MVFIWEVREMKIKAKPEIVFAIMQLFLAIFITYIIFEPPIMIEFIPISIIVFILSLSNIVKSLEIKK